MNPNRPLFLASFALLVGLAVIARPLPAPQQHSDDLAVRAYAILDQHCGECHGKGVSNGGFTFTNHKVMVDPVKGQVKPGDAQQSRLYIDAAHLPTADPMPKANAKDPAPLTSEQLAVLKAWIEAGAPEPKVALNSSAKRDNRAFISDDAVLRIIAQDLDSAGERQRPYLRYFTLTHLYNAGVGDAELKAYRVGLSRLINSLSWIQEITAPQSVDPAQSILRIDLRRYRWTEQTWKRLLEVYPYGVGYHSDVAKHIDAATGCDVPYIRADWFVARASIPPLYHDLLDLPTTAGALEARLMVDVGQDLQQETAARAGFNESGVSANNRVVERHRSPYGAYWRSYDFRTNQEKQNIFKHPLDFQEAGGEIIFNLPNGLQGYMLVNGKGERIDVGPPDIVFDKENKLDPLVHNGLTCMSCHAQGIKPFKDGVRDVILAADKNSVDYDRDHALALYIEKPGMDALLAQDVKRFANAVRATGSEVSDQEPIVALQQRYDGLVDLTQAAADVGLTAGAFRAKLNSDPKLGVLLGVLKTGGRLKRDAWESYYGDVVIELAPSDYRSQAQTASTHPSPVQQQNKDNSLAGTPQISVGVFGDSFHSNSRNIRLWEPITMGSGSVATPTREGLEIAFASSAGGFPEVMGGYKSIWKLRGDFDIEIAYKLQSWPQNNGVRFGMSLYAPGSEVVNLHRVFYSGEPGDSHAIAFHNFGGGNDTVERAPASGNTGKLRLVRSQGVFTGYYWQTATHRWQVIQSGGTFTGDLHVAVIAWSDDNSFSHSPVKVVFENFLVNRGQVVDAP